MQSIWQQTLPVTDVFLLTERVDDKLPFPAKISRVLNNGLSHIHLDSYDYLLRVDADVVLPKDFLEANLKRNLDALGYGFAQLIKMESFIKYLDGCFHPEHDDGYIVGKLGALNLRVSAMNYAVQPILKRPAGEHHGSSWYISQGFLEYKYGLEPLAFLAKEYRERKNLNLKPWMLVFKSLGYMKGLLKNEPLFDIGKENRYTSIHKYTSPMEVKRSVRRYFKGVPSWVIAPYVIQVELHNYCNLRCKYCNVKYFHEGKVGVASRCMIETLFQDFYVVTLRQAVEVRLFMNNEPTFIPAKEEISLPEALALAKKTLKAKTVIYSNATLTENKHLFLDPCLDEAHLTISAATAETYNAVHGKDLFNEALETFNYIKTHRRQNQKLFLHFVMVKENIGEIEQWRQLFHGADSFVVSPLHEGFNQEASKECKTGLKGIDTRKLSSLKGEIAADLPCTLWNNQSVSFAGDLLQCCDAPYKFNYGVVGKVDAERAYRQRLHNAMNNDACRACKLKNSNYKKLLKEYI